MNEEIIYALIEHAYAKQNNITDEVFFEKLHEILPDDWYLIPLGYRIFILNEAMNEKKLAKETGAYSNRPQEVSYNDKPKSH